MWLNYFSPPPRHRFRDIDKVDDLMEGITQQQELAQEISDAISKPVGFGEEFDEVSVGDFIKSSQTTFMLESEGRVD